jgi:hypothetical protein
MNQWQSIAINGNQWQSMAVIGGSPCGHMCSDSSAFNGNS